MVRVFWVRLTEKVPSLTALMDCAGQNCFLLSMYNVLYIHTILLTIFQTWRLWREFLYHTFKKASIDSLAKSVDSLSVNFTILMLKIEMTNRLQYHCNDRGRLVESIRQNKD